LEEFELAVARRVGVRHAVGVNSGTSGLHLAVLAAGLQENDLAITTPFSFVASSNCLLYERAVPIFVDVNRDSGTIDVAQVAQALEDLTRGGARARRWLPPALRAQLDPMSLSVKAIIPVDVFGQPSDLDPILLTARRHDLIVIQDACEAIGGQYKQRNVGSDADAAVFAFYPNKQMTTGEGGVIATNRDDWAALFRSLRNQGRDVFNSWLSHSRLGYNYRLDEMSAALGLAQLKRLDQLLAARSRVAAWYTKRLSQLEGIVTPQLDPTTTLMSWFTYVIRVSPRIGRNRLMDWLLAHDIPSRPYFSPIHLQPYYRDRFGYQVGDFPITEELGEISLALPFSSVMSEEQVDFVCNVIRSDIEAK
jgi:dTDP-4-amino-4,6-dideoxygalactose transaminase